MSRTTLTFLIAFAILAVDTARPGTVTSALFAIGSRLGIVAIAGNAPAEHERLRVRNDFKSPEDVVKYYCARDASGFVWSGLLDSEREAFTAWKQAPQSEGMLIASRYVLKSLPAAKNGLAKVAVTYALTGMSDAHGTRMPVLGPEMTVVFELKKTAGGWKIVSPLPEQVTPVVLESKFPSAAPAPTTASR